MVLRPAVRARLRLAVVIAAFVPVALLAKAANNGKLAALVQSVWAKAWKRYDAVRDAGSTD